MDRPIIKRSATDHTVVIGDVPSMYWKLLWDIGQFDDLQRNDADYMAPLAYSAINVCITATSLRDWAVAEVKTRSRHQGLKVPPDEQIRQRIYALVPHQKMCEAVASTAKHSRYEERDWREDLIRIDFIEPSEDDPGGFTLRHVQDQAPLPGIALNSFMAMKGDWRDALNDLGFTVPLENPDWWQGKMRQIFGDRSR